MRPVLVVAFAAAVASVVLPTVAAGAQEDPDEPFPQPQYLIHVTGHGTTSGDVKDDALVLFPQAPDGEGHFLSPDGSGGTIGWGSDFSTGPFDRPSAVCAAAIPLFKPGETGIGSLTSSADYVDCAAFGAPTTTIAPVTSDSTDSTDAATTTTLEANACNVRGTVTDWFGAPVPGIHIFVRAGGLTFDTSTLADGSYEFAEIGDDPGRGIFDSRIDPVNVSLINEEWAHTPQRYIVYYRQKAAVLKAEPFLIPDDGDCRVDFDMQAIPGSYTSVGPSIGEWPDVTQIYQGINRAWSLADMLGSVLDYGLPLKVLSFCDDPGLGCKPDGAAFYGTLSSGTQILDRPYLYIGTNDSLLTNTEWPDNREYHEFGHYVQSSLYRGTPDNDEQNHGGYANGSSTDSWAEGFAEFYSAMVSKYIDHDPQPELYAVGTSEYNLEDSWKPWLLEEMSLASVLFKLEKLTAETAALPPRAPRTFEPRGYTEVVDPTYGRLIVGHVANTTPDGPSIGTLAGVVFYDAAGQQVDAVYGTTIPANLGANGGEGLFVLPVPPGVVYTNLVVTVFEGKPPQPTPPVDPFDITLAELWSVIVNGTSSKTLSQGHLHDIEDVYNALKASFGGRGTVTAEGLDTIDQLFVENGLFDDPDGDRAFVPGDVIGRSSHPAFGNQDGCNDGVYMYCSPPRAPRTELDSPPFFDATVAIDTGGRAAAHRLVDVVVLYPDRHRSSGYSIDLDAAAAGGMVQVTVPPPGSGATLVLIVIADGHTPAVLGTIEADSFWQQAEQHGGQSFLQFSVALQPGDLVVPSGEGVPVVSPTVPATTPGSGGDGAPTASPASASSGPGGGAIAIVVVGLLAAGVAGGVIARRRRGS